MTHIHLYFCLNRPSDNVEMAPIVNEVEDSGAKRQFANYPIANR